MTMRGQSQTPVIRVGAPWFYAVIGKGVGALPPPAERELITASRVGTPGSPARQRAIDRAYDNTSRTYPTLFKD